MRTIQAGATASCSVLHNPSWWTNDTTENQASLLRKCHIAHAYAAVVTCLDSLTHTCPSACWWCPIWRGCQCRDWSYRHTLNCFDLGSSSARMLVLPWLARCNVPVNLRVMTLTITWLERSSSSRKGRSSSYYMYTRQHLVDCNVIWR